MIFTTYDFCKIYEAYSEPHRKYHNFSHVMSMFSIAQKLNIMLTETQELAIFLHDVVYQIGATDNELESAEYAKNILKSYSQHPFSIDKVVLCILSTKHHIPLCERANDVIDLDLSCFVFDYGTYRQRITEEFVPVYGVELFKQGRIKFLEKMLERESIFYGNKFYGCETVARTNINTELRELKGQ